MENLAGSVKIDWKWVEAHLTARERLAKISKDSTKEAVLGSLAKALAETRLKAAPKIAIVKKIVTNFGPTVIGLEGGLTLDSKELSSYIKGSSHIYAFLATIGKDIEEAATSYMNAGDHLLGYLMDRVGSFAVESMAKNMEDALRNDLARENLSVSMRFSPGYCDWPIEEQFKLAKIIDFGKAGVRLTESCVMIPRKSITAIVGIGPNKLFSEVKSPCAVCNMKVCDYRRND